MYFSLLSVIFVQISICHLLFQQNILSLVMEIEILFAKNRQFQK